MPSWTLGKLMSTATIRIGHRADIAASDVSFWINEAYMEVAQLANPSLLEFLAYTSIVSGESRIAPPDAFQEVIHLSYFTPGPIANSNGTLKRISTEEMDAKGHYPVAKSTSYAMYNDWIELWPSPDSSYSLLMRYRSYATDMVDTSDIPSVETEWRKAILYLGEAYLHELVGNNEEGAVARGRYYTYTQSLKDAKAHRDSTGGEVRLSLSQRRRRY